MLTFPTLITGTITGLRISAVDGTAFIDNAGAIIPTYADGNHQIEIYDSSNRMLRGVLKAAGTGETLLDVIGGTNPALKNGDFSGGDTVWNKGAGWTIPGTGVASHAAGASGNIWQSPLTANALYKLSIGISVASGGSINIGYGSNFIGVKTANYSGYGTTNSTILQFSGSSAGTKDIDNIVCQQVLTPSTDGVTIVSTKGGATQSFTSKDASFTYNAASYRYAIYDTLKVSRPTRYMGVSTHNI